MKDTRTHQRATPPAPDTALAPSATLLLHSLLATSVIPYEDWDALDADLREELLRYHAADKLLPRLIQHGLLTEFQSRRIETGTSFGLVLGNYRLLDRLGAGGMGVVYRAEHLRMRRQVAIKVIQIRADQDQRVLRRFLSEIRAVAKLKHANIVAAFDAGETSHAEEAGLTFHYFVMEYIPGQDLEQHVKAHGPLTPTLATDLMHQVASALSEAHRHQLVHRDIKPSNIQVTPEWQAKLLDFGLARNFQNGRTESGSLIGTIDYMAPEQMRDAHTVDVRADLYGLGGTLYWCLTGETPFPSQDNVIQELNARLTQPPPSLRRLRPELPVELDALVQKLLALHPDDRYPTAESVMQALLAFPKPPRSHPPSALEITPAGVPAFLALGVETPVPAPHRVLVVDAEPGIRAYCRHALSADGLLSDEVGSGQAAVKALANQTYDLVLLDLGLPDVVAAEVCKRLHENPPSAHLKIILMSGGEQADAMAQLLLCGADDFLTKPFSRTQLRARVRTALRLKVAQDRSDQLIRQLRASNGLK